MITSIDGGVPSRIRRAPQQLVEKRYEGVARILPSVLISRISMVLLIAPWILLLARSTIYAAQGVMLSNVFFLLYVQLAVVTFCGLAVVKKRIGELKHYEALREHERLLFSYSRDGMLLIRVGQIHGNQTPSFVVQAENPTAVDRLSAIGQATSYVGCDIREAFPAWLYRQLIDEYTACYTRKQVRRYRVCNPDGTMAHESVATPVIDPRSGKTTHIVVAMRDLQERVAQERAISAALQKAEAANKTKSEFLASMSHELRTPLNAILGFSDALKMGIRGPISDGQREYLDHIHQSGGHLLNIISDILDLSKIEAGKFVLHEEDTDIESLIEACLQMVKERAGAKGLFLKTTIQTNLPKLHVDPLRLKQILINLLSNAIKFTDMGGVILSAEFSLSIGFEFSVTDTGIGMTEAQTKLALQPFGQVESAYARNHDGPGLGLPIASHLAVLHGGRLTVSSSPALGTRAALSLPRARARLPKTVDAG